MHGARGSDHRKGLTAEFIAPHFGTPFDIWDGLANERDLVFGQLIHEFGAWVHLSDRW